MNTSFDQALKKAMELSLKENYAHNEGENKVGETDENMDWDKEGGKEEDNWDNTEWDNTEWNDTEQNDTEWNDNKNEIPGDQSQSESSFLPNKEKLDPKKVKPTSPPKEPPRKGMKLVTVVKNGGWVTQEWR